MNIEEEATPGVTVACEMPAVNGNSSSILVFKRFKCMQKFQRSFSGQASTIFVRLQCFTGNIT